MKIVTVLLCLSVVLNIWLGNNLARLENYRYGNLLGMCETGNSTDTFVRINREKCLDKTETRIHPIFHVLYALGIL